MNNKNEGNLNIHGEVVLIEKIWCSVYFNVCLHILSIISCIILYQGTFCA